jgi:hypothetical protein
VLNGCDSNSSSYTYLGIAYTKDTGLAGNQFFTGGYTFTVKEIEVFGVLD